MMPWKMHIPTRTHGPNLFGITKRHRGWSFWHGYSLKGAAHPVQINLEKKFFKNYLEKKGIVGDATCETCHASDESPAHIIFGCTTTSSSWNAVGITTFPHWQIQKLMDIQHPSHIPACHFGTFILLCCWHIWKWHNNRTFRTDRTTLAGALAACKAEAFLWGARLPKADKEVATSWCHILANAM